MKKGLKNAISFVSFICLLLILLKISDGIFMPSYQESKKAGVRYTIKGFYKIPKNSIDVLFLGDSSMFNGVSPMELYEQTGITSYNFSTPSARAYMYYYWIQEIEKYQQPKVIVIDPLTFYYSQKEKETHTRKAIDFLKNDEIKIKMINDDIYEYDFETKLSFIIPTLRFHARWEELKLSDIKKIFKNYTSYTLGYNVGTAVKKNNNYEHYMDPKDKKVVMKDYVKEYFDKFYHYCHEKSINIVVLGIPDENVWGYNENEALKEFLSGYDNVYYLDANNNEYNLDWDYDFTDGKSHYNLSGASKMTKYVGEYLTSHYTFEKKSNKITKFYDSYLKKYKKIMVDYEKKYQDNLLKAQKKEQKRIIKEEPKKEEKETAKEIHKNKK